MIFPHALKHVVALLADFPNAASSQCLVVLFAQMGGVLDTLVQGGDMFWGEVGNGLSIKGAEGGEVRFGHAGVVGMAGVALFLNEVGEFGGPCCRRILGAQRPDNFREGIPGAGRLLGWINAASGKWVFLFGDKLTGNALGERLALRGFFFHRPHGFTQRRQGLPLLLFRNGVRQPVGRLLELLGCVGVAQTVHKFRCHAVGKQPRLLGAKTSLVAGELFFILCVHMRREGVIHCGFHLLEVCQRLGFTHPTDKVRPDLFG